MQYICTNCEYHALQWSGRCPNCGEWGTYEEMKDADPKVSVSKGVGTKGNLLGENVVESAESVNLSELMVSDAGGRDTDFADGYDRIDSGIGELNRVLGGGIVQGEAVLISGEPGIGKSTLLTQLASNIGRDGDVLYVSGEESLSQVASRFKRLFGKSQPARVKISTEQVVEKVGKLIDDMKPDLVIIDSIQTALSLQSRGVAGSLSQVRTAGGKLVQYAKRFGVPMFIVGQVNKEGVLAGPKILEHSVDCVIHLEGDQHRFYRILRSSKNRYGPTGEIGVFEMGQQGLQEVANPSQVFLSDGAYEAGTVLSGIVQGSRVVFVEVQALVVERQDGEAYVRRVAQGIKRSRLEVLTAVLTKRGGLRLWDKDIFVNIAGGLVVDDPSMDLAICMAIKSAVEDKPVPAENVYIGEVGLTGVVKNFPGAVRIVKEAVRLGYKKVFMPKTIFDRGGVRRSAKKVGVGHVRDL